jgi:ribonuclease HII
MQFIIGCDEVGYGCLAGPVVVCGVRAPEDWFMAGLKDSKKFKTNKSMTAHEQRTELALELKKLTEKGDISFHLAERSNTQIDNVGVAVALKDSYVETFHSLYQTNDKIIVDGTLKFTSYNLKFNVESVIKADDKYNTVKAASIIAKSYRDSMMFLLHNQYPVYDWWNNSGYGSPMHLEGIDKHGPCKLHRFSYAPMKNMNKK